ncbi:siderophore-interacting protein [Ensifer adhaerens]|uniref:siderophore-interacting protein n=1 Tax=Ensifer adhaerens TaxID=106592 RepID=UPI000CF19622|nr:SIP domain-containing protein [Ensifer adhaerens]
MARRNPSLRWRLSWQLSLVIIAVVASVIIGLCIWATTIMSPNTAMEGTVVSVVSSAVGRGNDGQLHLSETHELTTLKAQNSALWFVVATTSGAFASYGSIPAAYAALPSVIHLFDEADIRGAANTSEIATIENAKTWPEGENELLVRVYTIRAVDRDRGELWIDFLQHPAPGISTPGADFARNARPGDVAALLGPAAGGLPEARTILLIGDESALPAIARIAAEAPVETKMGAIIEVEGTAEEQLLQSDGMLNVQWLHRASYPHAAADMLVQEAKAAIEAANDETFVWVACEKSDVRTIKTFLKARNHDRRMMYVAWYWERDRTTA